MDETQLINSIDNLISDIKACIRAAGINNDSSEFQIVTEIFLYKFLNDKLRYELKKISPRLASARSFDSELNCLSQDEFESLTDQLDPDTAVINRDQTISFLYQNREYRDDDGNDFAWLLDETLIKIANANADIFSVSTGSKDRIKLFEGVCRNIIDTEKRNGFAKAVIGKLVNAQNFEAVFEEKYDFFSTIFEHLISEYNSNGGGVNAEYYTPKSIAQIIGRILVRNPVQNVEVYDPTAGSGTLLMAIAHQIGEDRCTIYSQDLTQKSVKLLRLNLILNSLTHSLPNVKQADILLSPQFTNEAGNNLREFDFIVSNPPFKVDFSEAREECVNDPYIKKDGHKRYFAGVPKVPAQDKKKMPIYLLVLQHIIFSLKENGKAGIVVPTKFLDWTNSIARTIRKYLVDNHFLRAVVCMPSNVFANTGTNVSVIFVDKENLSNEVLLFDASKMGTQETISINEKKVKKTVLSEADEECIVKTINERQVREFESILIDTATIADRNYSLVAGQYFNVKIEYEELTEDEFNERIREFETMLADSMSRSEALNRQVLEEMRAIKHG
ncbi:MAG: class I SAM-dependent DNA methyltransferase [Bacilli bacterium]|nr:class I SAM-dependent DNA methyltransferase [Bacilli bacterium]